jgi:hypothetical protein
MAIGHRILDGTVLFLDCSGMYEGVFDDQLPEVERRSKREIGDSIGMN